MAGGGPGRSVLTVALSKFQGVTKPYVGSIGGRAGDSWLTQISEVPIVFAVAIISAVAAWLLAVPMPSVLALAITFAPTAFPNSTPAVMSLSTFIPAHKRLFLCSASFCSKNGTSPGNIAFKIVTDASAT